MHRELLEEYKVLTLEIIKSLEDDNNMYLNLLDERNKIVNKIIAIDEYKNEFKNQYVELDLPVFDKKLEQLIKFNISDMKQKIQSVQRGQKALNGYSSACRMPNMYTRIL